MLIFAGGGEEQSVHCRSHQGQGTSLAAAIGQDLYCRCRPKLEPVAPNRRARNIDSDGDTIVVDHRRYRDRCRCGREGEIRLCEDEREKENETHEEIRDFISLNCNSWRALPCIPSCRT